MKLSEIFDQLQYGELSQLHIGGVEQGGISEANYPRILPHVNLGLTALYKRFSLKENALILSLQPNILQYSLHSRFAVNGKRSKEPVRYIIDTTLAPFLDDIIKVARVYTDDGTELDLNNKANAWSLHTPFAHSLAIPAVIVEKSTELPANLITNNLKVVYRANHPKIEIPIGYFNPDRIEVELPDSHLEPLLLFIASRLHNPIGMVNEFNAGNNYAAKYEAACQALEIANLNVDQGSQSDRLRQRGFV